jgi:anti-anti-sigma regulatory factor
MLRIIEEGTEHGATLKLAGRLAGEWTSELERCWREAAAQPQSISVDLTEVTFVDESGKRLLAAMARTGVELIAANVLLKALVEQIAQGTSFDEDATEDAALEAPG